MENEENKVLTPQEEPEAPDTPEEPEEAPQPEEKTESEQPKKAKGSARKKVVAALIVIALFAAAGAVAGHVLKKPEAEPIPEVDELQPVFADPFPDTPDEAARLLNQKLILIKGDARYHVDAREESWACDSIVGELTEAKQKLISDTFAKTAKAHSAALPADDPAAAALFGALLESGLPEAESYTAEKTESGVFRFTFHFGAGALDPLETAQDTFKDVFAEAFTMLLTRADKDAIPVGLQISAEINGYNGLLTDLTVARRYRADAAVDIADASSENSKVQAGCFLTQSISYSIRRDGVFVDNKIMQLRPGKHKNLKYTVNLPEGKTDADYTVTYRTSDPGVLTVDETGKMEGIAASPVSALVYVTLTFTDGTVYFDMCEVYVTVPVKGVTLTPETLALKPEETAVLTASVTPADATITDIVWVSENTDVAAVDENGKVTAIAAGETKIFAVTKDGQFRKSCIVTVEGE